MTDNDGPEVVPFADDPTAYSQKRGEELLWHMARKADEMRMADRRLRMDVLMGHVLERLQEEAAAAASAAHGNPHIAWSSRLIDIARWDCDDEENAE